jgi:hypothetical protein
MMENQSPTRRDLETALIEKCWKDPEFKMQLISDPKGMLERHTGQKLPPELTIFIHEEDANTLHFSIPPAPAKLAELSEEQLERVAGGQAQGPGGDPVVITIDPRTTAIIGP